MPTCGADFIISLFGTPAAYSMACDPGQPGSGPIPTPEAAELPHTGEGLRMVTTITMVPVMQRMVLRA